MIRNYYTEAYKGGIVPTISATNLIDNTVNSPIIITDNKDLYDKAAEFSDHGHMHIPNIPRGLDPRRIKGLNLRMSELTAAVGIAQLSKIDFILI